MPNFLPCPAVLTGGCGRTSSGRHDTSPRSSSSRRIWAPRSIATLAGDPLGEWADPVLQEDARCETEQGARLPDVGEAVADVTRSGRAP